VKNGTNKLFIVKKKIASTMYTDEPKLA